MEPELEPIKARPVRGLESRGATIANLPVVGHKFCGLENSPRLIGEVSVIPEPDNPVDPNAVAVYEDGKKVGYIPKKNLSWIHNLLSGHLTHVRKEEGLETSEITLPALFLNIEPDVVTGKDYGALALVGLDSEGNVELGSCAWLPTGEVVV